MSSFLTILHRQVSRLSTPGPLEAKISSQPGIEADQVCDKYTGEGLSQLVARAGIAAVCTIFLDKK